MFETEKFKEIDSYLKDNNVYFNEEWFVSFFITPEKNYEKLIKQNRLVWSSISRTPRTDLSIDLRKNWVNMGLVKRVKMNKAEINKIKETHDIGNSNFKYKINPNFD